MATYRRQYELETTFWTKYYLIKEQKERNYFGSKDKEVFCRWSENDRHKHFKLLQWMKMYRGMCILHQHTNLVG